MPKFKKAGIKIGKPLDFSMHAGMENDRELVQKLTDRVMDEIGKLIGQEVEGEMYQFDEILPKDRKEEG